MDTFIDLTGGITESIKTKDTTVNQLFSKIKEDLARGSIIACTLPVSRGSSLNSLDRNNILFVIYLSICSFFYMANKYFSVLFCSVLFCSVLFCSVLFHRF